MLPLSFRLNWFALLVAAITPGIHAQQVVPAAPAKPDDTAKLEKSVVTGSSIKRPEGEGALPLQIITSQQLEEVGVDSTEQMIMALNINGNGLDNLASNADVVTGEQRTNGSTAANLRLQGAGSTLVLLNGRRVAAAGLNGAIVDLNQIPFAALERVEVLKDGASATYGTDAIGGVINFTTKTNYRGVSASTASDVTQEGGGNIYRYSLVAGFGNLGKDRFNMMTTLSQSVAMRLSGDQRSWDTTFKPDQGLTPDTRGTPIANAFAIASLYNALSRDNLSATGRGTGPLDPTNPTLNVNGLSIVGLPGGPTYASLTGINAEQPYNYLLWNLPSGKYGSAWDTGRAAVLQQPVRNTNSVTRGTYQLGAHRISGEIVLGRSESNKSFSPVQVTSGTAATTLAPDGVTVVANPLYNLAYPATGPDYNRVFDILAGYFPSLAANRGQPIPFRWRAMPFGNREIHTNTTADRFLVSSEGPISLFSQWEYRAGVSHAASTSYSVLNNGYFYQVPFAALINSGVVDPFSLTQTPAALAAIASTRADGLKLFDGTSTTDEADVVFSGPLLKLPAGTAQLAIGLDGRIEKYAFAGDGPLNLSSADALVLTAPFQNTAATNGTLKRNIDAAFAEGQLPLLKGLDLNAAVRLDRYTGFGRTINPKFSLRYAPAEALVLRSSYSTGFHVPTFKQMFDPKAESAYGGNDIADPAAGTNGVVTASAAAVHPDLITGGKPDLQPEKAKMFSAGFVVAPTRHFSANVDFWAIDRTGTIQSQSLSTFLQNYDLFRDRFTRDAAGNLTAIDIRWVNTGGTITKGVDVGLNGDCSLGRGKLSGGFDLSYLLDKRTKLLSNSPWDAEEINQFTRSGDLGLRWKHTAFVSYRKSNWSTTFNQLYRNSYADAVLPGVALGLVHPPDWHAMVKAYDIFGLSVTYRGIKHLTVTAGIKNLFNTPPPFSAFYDTVSGGGSDWEPRVADPRGRSFTTRVEYNFR